MFSQFLYQRNAEKQSKTIMILYTNKRFKMIGQQWVPNTMGGLLPSFPASGERWHARPEDLTYGEQ